MAMHTCFGDGSEIPLADVTHVRDTLYKNMVFNRWEKGDIVMIDNFRVSHGRQVLIIWMKRFICCIVFLLIELALCWEKKDRCGVVKTSTKTKFQEINVIFVLL